MKKLIAALALALVVASPVNAGSVQPFNVTAQSAQTIQATGYRGSVQIRPYSTVTNFAWVGGYLADGTFVQNGIEQPSPINGGVATAFVWFQTAGAPPLYIPLPGAAYPDFYEFRAEKAGSVWTFSYTGPDGINHVQQTATGASTLMVFQADAETWMESWGTFPTQAMRAINTRTGTTWAVPHLIFSPSEPVCGEAEIKPTPGLNLVFRSTAGGSPCYVVLS